MEKENNLNFNLNLTTINDHTVRDNYFTKNKNLDPKVNKFLNHLDYLLK
jgi:hypothetical protein